jgi:hypothetical protein
MRYNDISRLISEMVRGSANPITEDEMAKFLDNGNFDGVQAMVFLPTGDGYLLTDEESEQERSDNK